MRSGAQIPVWDTLGGGMSSAGPWGYCVLGCGLPAKPVNFPAHREFGGQTTPIRVNPE